MRGNNTLILYEGTILDALQYYFDNVLYKESCAPKVVSVDRESGHGSYSKSFRVEVGEKEKEK